MGRGGGVLPHHQVILQCQFCNSAQFWHYLPRDSIRSHRLRAPSHKTALHFRCQCKSRFLFVLLTKQPSIRGSCESLLGLNEFARVAHRLRGALYLLDYGFITKEYNPGMAIWECCKGQSMGKWRGAAMFSPSARLAPNLPTFINIEAPWILSLWVFLEAFFFYTGMMG